MANPPPAPPKTYREWYGNASVGLPLDNATLYHTFRCDPNPPAPLQLRTMASNNLESKLLFLGLDNNGSSFAISRYHELQPSLGRPSAFAGRGFSTSRDIRADGGTVTVQPDDSFMNLARGGVAIVVPTLAALRQELTTNPPAGNQWTIGPYAAGDADTEAVQVRLTVPVPAKYAHLVLDGGDTGLQLFQKLDAAIQADNAENENAPLYAWLRAAVTLVTINNADSVTVRMPAPTAVDRDDALDRDRSSILNEDLPHRVGNPTVTGELAGGLAGIRESFQGLRTDADNRALAQARKDEEEKTVTKRYAIVLPRLMRICQASNSDQLPRLWHELAKHKESQGQVVMETVLSAARDASPLSAPLMFVSPILVSNLKRGVFAASREEDIYTGFSIFLFCVGTGASRAAADQIAATMDAVQQSRFGASVSDMESARSKLKAHPVETALGLQRVLIQYSHAADGILGATHKAAEEYCLFCNEVADDNEHLERILAEDKTNGMRFLFAIYLLWWIWFKQQEKSARLEDAPNFQFLWMAVKSRSWTPPALPAEFNAWVAACARVRHNQDEAAGPPPAREGGNDTQRNQGNRTQGSRNQGNNENRTGNGRVTIKAHERVDAITIDANAPINAIRAGREVPKNDAGIEFCLSYHKRGECFANCNRKEDHTQHNDGETGRLVGYLGQHA